MILLDLIYQTLTILIPQKYNNNGNKVKGLKYYLEQDIYDKNIGTVSNNTFIFTDNYQIPNYDQITIDAKNSLLIDNAGGKSDISELYSIDYFTKIYNAHNIIYEKQVVYWIDYKMVDYICTINNSRVGVSVARAMGYPSIDKFTDEMASKLLYKKLYGLIVARNGVIKSQSFYRSILHIWCQDISIANKLYNAFSNLNDDDYGLDVKGIVILQLTICPDERLYKNIIY